MRKTEQLQNPVCGEWAIVMVSPVFGPWKIIDRGHPSQLSAERKLAVLEGRDPDLVGRYACQDCGIEVKAEDEECPSCLCRTFDGPFFEEKKR